MKIAFLVQPDWLYQHFGVRNLFVALFSVLQNYGNNCDFIFYNKHGVQNFFYKMIIEEWELTENVDCTIQQKNGIMPPRITSSQKNFYQQFLGNCIDEQYDAIIYTNPWLLTDNLNIKAKKHILLCHDVVANKLSLIDSCVYHWGFLHNDGYLYAKRENMHFLSNSKKTDVEMVDYYSPKHHSFLPPLRPAAFFNIQIEKELHKENAIILAAPFDKRKGMDNIPEYLLGLKEKIDTIYIFGQPRCCSEDWRRFWKKMSPLNVKYFSSITNKDLIDLYKKSKFLLFPSIEEGLGIPLIEAQLCGYRVITKNIHPMNDLTIDGILLTDDFSSDIKKIGNELTKKFDYADLANKAEIQFSNENVYFHLKQILGDS